jgi:4-amino-4-deoxy-L-arabinose transferase-like glycosyltransferase
MDGNDAIKTLETGQFKVFYPENNGREGLFIWLIAFSFKLFGPAVWSLRLVSAILGILTVLGLYLLAKELFDKNIALLSSFFLAISFWHVNFSRIGFRAILVPFLICFTFYFLFRAFRKNSLLDYTWAGIFFGLGFYTYIAFRMAVLILGIVILIKMIEYWRVNKPVKINWSWLWKKVYLKDGWWKVDLFFIIILIIALPIGLYFLNHPQDFIGRASGVSIFNSQQPLKELGISTIKTLGMFNWAGDWNWRHNYAGSPMLAWSVGILFVLGLALVIAKLARQFAFCKTSGVLATNKRSEAGREPDRNEVAEGGRDLLEGSRPRSEYYLPKTEAVLQKANCLAEVFLLSWFLIMLLPAILTTEGIPHALRTIGVIPVVYIFAALGLVWLLDKLSKIKKAQYIAPLLLVLFLIQPTIANFNKYFFKWAKNPNVAGAFRQDLVDLANYLNNLPDNIQKYVIVNESGVPVPYPDGLPMPAQTIIFESKIKDSKIKYLLASKNSQVEINIQPTVIIPLKYDQTIFQQLAQVWPSGKIKQINGFTAYEIK